MSLRERFLLLRDAIGRKTLGGSHIIDQHQGVEEAEYAALVLAQDAIDAFEDLAGGRVLDEAELERALHRAAERMNGAADD